MDKDYIRLAVCALLVIAAIWNNSLSEEAILLLIAGILFPTTIAYQNATKLITDFKHSTR